MKAFTQIEFEIDILRKRLTQKETIRNNNLHQIDMLSNTGNKLRGEIDVIKGNIIALTWVVNDNINGSIYLI